MRINRPSHRPQESGDSADGRLNSLSMNVEQHEISEKAASFANKPVAYRGNIIREHSKQLLRRLDATGKQWHEHLATQGWEEHLSDAFADDPKTQTLLGSIFNKLSLDAPDETGEPRHPYIQLQKESVKGMRGSLVTARISADIHSDMRYLDGLLQRGINPDQRTVVEELRGALQEYASHDYGRMVAERWRDQSGKHYPDQAMLEMGRTAGVLIAGAAALFTGAMELKQGRFPISGLLYGGIAGLLAFPGVITSLFAGKNQASLNEIDKHLNKPAFKKAAKQSRIEGPRWTGFMDAQLKREPALMSFNEKMRRGTATEDDKRAISEQYFGDGPESRHFAQLTQDPAAYDSVASFSDMRDDDAKKTALLFVKERCAQYFDETQAGLKEAKRANDVA